MEDISDIDRLGIPKLTGAANYWPWSVQVKTVLIGRDLWDVVEKGVYTPLDTALTEAKEGESKPKDAASTEAQGTDLKSQDETFKERRTV